MKTICDLRFSSGLPFALKIAVEDHMDALEDEALRLVLEGEDAFRAQDRALLLISSLSQGMNFSGSTSPSMLRATDCMSSS